MDSERIRSLLDLAGLESRPSTGFRVDGVGGVLRGRHAIDEVASVIIGLTGAAAADFHMARSGESQSVSVDIEEAASAVSSIDANTIEGKAIPFDPQTAPAAGRYQCRNRDWIQLHGSLPHLRRGTLDLLGCANTFDAIAEAISRWDASTLEDAMSGRGLCAARVRTWSEWREHPQGRLVTERSTGNDPAHRLGPATTTPRG